MVEGINTSTKARTIFPIGGSLRYVPNANQNQAGGIKTGKQWRQEGGKAGGGGGGGNW